MALGEQRPVLATVALVGRDEADRAVAMLEIVPSSEALDPCPRRFDRCEAAGRPVGRVLAGPEQRFGKRVVIADARPADRCDYTELLHLRLHRCAPHSMPGSACSCMHERGAAVVGMKNERTGQAPLGPDRALQDLGGELGRLAVVDLPADDLAAEDVDDEIEVEEGTGDRPRQPRYVPRPDLARCLGLEAGGWLAVRGRTGATAAMVLASLAQHPVEAGFRGDPDALVGQSRHDLAGGKTGEFRLRCLPYSMWFRAIGRQKG